MEPASGPLAKWASSPESSKRRSSKKEIALNLSVLEKISPKEEAALPLAESPREEPTPQASRVKPLDLSKLDQMGRRPSPPRTLEVQRQRIMAKRALSLSNVKEVLSARSPKESPKESPLTLSGELRKGGIFFDHEFKAEMEKRLKEHRHTILDAAEIDKLAYGFVHNAVDELFIDEKHPEQFCIVAIREKVQFHAKIIYNNLVSCQVLVSPLVERLKFLRKEVITFLNEKKRKASFSDDLLQYLNLLIDTHKLQTFLDIYRKTTWDMGILQLGREACGPNMPACLEVWKGWLEPNKFQTLQSPFIHNVLDNMALTKLPGKRYVFPQKLNPMPIINSIGCYEVSRCLYNGGSPNYSNIIFAGESVSYLKRVNINEPKDTEEDFFRQVFLHLRKLGYPAANIDKEEVDIFMDFRRTDLKPLQSYLKEGGTDFTEMERLVGLKYVNSRVFAVLYNRHSLSAENIQGLLPSYFIPSFCVLQRACMSSWSVGHEYFMKKFDNLFVDPFWTRLHTDIKIEFRKDGYVIQTKTYKTGKRVNKDSLVFDDSFNPIHFQFRWHVKEGEHPFFELVSITIPAEVNWKDKWSIIQRVIETTHDDELDISYIANRLAALGAK